MTGHAARVWSDAVPAPVLWPNAGNSAYSDPLLIYAAVLGPGSHGRINLGQNHRRRDGEGRIWHLPAGRIRPDSAALPRVLTFIVP